MHTDTNRVEKCYKIGLKRLDKNVFLFNVEINRIQI